MILFEPGPSDPSIDSKLHKRLSSLIILLVLLRMSREELISIRNSVIPKVININHIKFEVTSDLTIVILNDSL